MDFYCAICDKTIKLRCKKKHLNTRLHKSLSHSIINRYCAKNPEFLQIENILKNMFVIIITSLSFLLLSVNGN